MTQEDLALAAGVAVGTVQNIESEKTVPQKAKLAPVLSVLGLDRKHTEHWTDDQWFVAETAVAFFDQVPVARQPQAAARLVDLLAEMLLPSSGSSAPLATVHTLHEGADVSEAPLMMVANEEDPREEQGDADGR